jgi:hypothetical protein
MASPYQDFLAKARARYHEGKIAEAKKRSTGEYSFTRHSEYKMRQYRLSPQRIRSVIRNPKRREEGIIPNTVGVMQPTSIKRKDGQETWTQEIWCLYKVSKGQKKIISAWRYPGVSPKRDPIPEDILQELLDKSILEEEN